MSSGISLEFVLGRAGVEIVTPQGGRVALTFLDAPEDPDISASSGGFSFAAKTGVRASAYLQDDRATLALTQKSAFPVALRVHIEGATVTQSDTDSHLLFLDTGVGILDMTLIGVQIQDGDSVPAAGTTTLLLMNAEGRIEVAPTGTAVSLFSVPAYDPGVPAPSESGARFVVPAGRRPPEFAVGVYDDVAFARPRPTRFGVPVVSTVPVDGTGIVTGSADSEWIRLGIGPDTRTMYFKVICNQAIEVVPNGAPSSLVQLNLYLPGGIDTLNLPVPVQLRASSDGSGNVAYYYGNFTFHREDTIDYVDGFAYILASPALTMSSFLPIKLQVSRVGGYTPPSYEADAQQVSDMSFQGSLPKGIVSAFSMAAASAARYTPRRQVRQTLPLALTVHRVPKTFLELRLAVKRSTTDSMTP